MNYVFLLVVMIGAAMLALGFGIALVCLRAVRDARELALAAEHTRAVARRLFNPTPSAEPPSGGSPREPKNRPSLAVSVLTRVMATILLAAIGSIAHYVTAHLFEVQHYETAQAQQMDVPLKDGSVIQLNENTKIEVRLNPLGREVLMAKGEARFNVAHDAEKPFRVRAAMLDVRVTGTVFNVRSTQGSTEVCLLQGQVQVRRHAGGDAEPEQINLRPGECATSQPAESALLRSEGIAAQAAIARFHQWPSLWVSFDNEPLGNVLAKFNRYHKLPIHIADNALALQPVNGRFNLYDRSSLLQALRVFGVRMDDDRDGVLWLSMEGAARAEPEDELLRFRRY